MKGRKLLSAIIAGAMVLSTMSFPVFAEGSTVTAPVEEFMSLNAQNVYVEHEIDLKGATVDITDGYYSNIYADITIKNGTINFSDFTTSDGIFRIGYWENDSPVTLKLENMTINVKNVTAHTGVFTMQNQDDMLVLNNSTINATGITDTPGIFYTPNCVDSVRGSVEITGGRMNIETDSALFFNNDVDLNSTVITCEVDRPVFRQSAGSVEDTTITVNDVIDSATRGIVEDIAGNPDGTVEFKNSKVVAPEGQTFVKANTPGKVLAVADADSTYTTVDDSGNETPALMTSVADVEAVEDIVASIGSAKYLTFADALAAAQDGDTIDLLDNTIALDGQTTIDKDITIINGTFDITGANCTTEGIIYIDNKTVEFNNVDFVGSDFTSAFGVIFANHNANVTLDSCDFTLENDLAPKGGTLKGNDNASFTVKNCTFDLENPSRVLTGITLNMSNTTINAYVTDSTRTANDLNNHAFRNVYGVIKDSTIDVTGTETGLKNTDGGSLSITGTSNVSFTNTVDANIYLNDEKETLTVEPSANVIGNIVYGTMSNEVITDTITVKLAPTDKANVYDIVLDGNYKAIYEFVSAEIQFVNAGNGYEISGTDDINVIPNTANTDRYGFYLKDGAVANRKTGTEIKIGTVTFPEQGTIKFKVDADNSKVVATEYNTHHEKYYTEADANAKLTADANGINSTIAAKTRDVAINVDFAHTLDNTGWNGNHQITVTLKDAFGNIVGDKAYPLAIANNAGTYTFPNVPIGRITVTLKAPGFRTFTYTTTVEEGANEDDALVLNFWNDTKRDTEKAVEIGGRTMPNNFVVGDIVMDYTVDKYDLAAVTSYYGTYNLTDEKKIRYDLNRDGSIDITDVAYVLHNFGF